MRWPALVTWLLCGGLLVLGARGDTHTPRRPVAIRPSLDGTKLYVANRNGQSLSIVDAASRRVEEELPLAARPVDLLVLEAGLVVLHDAPGGISLWQRTRGSWQRQAQLAIASPSTLARGTGGQLFVAARWPRQLHTLSLELGDAPTFHHKQSLALSFEPGELCFLPKEEKLLVAGAFVAQIAVVDTASGQQTGRVPLPGHNIRGMFRLGDKLYLAQQVLNPRARSSRDDIHWGNLLENVLVSLPLSHLLDGRLDVKRQHKRIRLGGPGAGAADPGKIVQKNGMLHVLSSGAHAVLTVPGKGQAGGRVNVPPRPVDACVSARNELWVVSMSDDSLSLLDEDGVHTVSLGESGPASLSERGEALFFDGALSHDGWLSCHSCHSEGHSFGGLCDTQSDGSFGTPKRVLSLLGVARTPPYAWNGSMQTLAAQVRASLEKTMHSGRFTDDQVTALVAYLETLRPPPPLPLQLPEDSVRAGHALFRSSGCTKCHHEEEFTSPARYDVGLQDERQWKEFNPPSLRGVARRDRLFHDGRAHSLDDVLSRHKHPAGEALAPGDVAKLLSYLKSL